MLASNIEANVTFESLILQLVALSQGKPSRSVELAGHAGNDATQTVLFDGVVEGARYTLMRAAPANHADHVSLSPREQEIVLLVGQGLGNKAISDLLEISPWTVGTYLKRIFAKLGVSTRAEMVVQAIQQGLLSARGS